MKKIYLKKRNSHFNLTNLYKREKGYKKKKTQASMLKNVMYNKKDVILFSVTGVVKFKKINSLGKSFSFVGSASRTSIKYTADYKYPGIIIF